MGDTTEDTQRPSRVALVAFALGFVAIVGGVALVYVPAALIVAGVLLIVAGLDLAGRP